jgi:glutaredoxin 2
MPRKKLEQLQIEVDTWKRFIDFFREENIHLKNRLSNILKNKFDTTLLEQMENFQSKFIKHDGLIIFLKKDITELDKLLMIEKSNQNKISDVLDNKFDKFRRNLVNSEKQFYQLQIDFNGYLAKNIL